MKGNMKALFLFFTAIGMPILASMSMFVNNLGLSFNNFVNDIKDDDSVTIPFGAHKIGSGNGDNGVSESNGGVTATVTMGSEEISAVTGESYMLITLEGDELKVLQQEKKRKPVNLSIVIDRSGSMSGEKLSSVKSALRDIGSYLHDGDKVALVVYDNSVKTLIHSQPFNERKFISKVEQIEDGGSTNLEGGLIEGLEEVSGQFIDFSRAYDKGSDDDYIDRVILLSDGLANVGIDSPSGLAAIVNRAEYEGITVSTIGVGADYDERVMTEIARAGRGNYYFMETPREAQEIFSKEFSNLTQMVANNINVEMSIVNNGANVSWSTKIIGIGYDHDGSKIFSPYDIQAGVESTYLFSLKAQDGSYFIENNKNGTIDFANIVVTFDSQETGRREKITLPVTMKIVNGDVNTLSNDYVYSEYMRSYVAEELLGVYEDLDKQENSVAKESLDEVYDNLEQANIRLNGAFAGDIQAVEEKQEFVENLENDYIKDTRFGRIFQKTVQSESYSRVYNK